MTATPAAVPRASVGVKVGAWLAFVLMLVITFSSAYIRLAQAAGAEDSLDLARGVHRLAATLALVVILGVAILAWDSFQPLKPSRVAAGALVGFAFALGLLGLFGPADALLVTLGNPLGGLAMLGCAWWLCLAAGIPRAGGNARSLAGWLGITAAFAALAAAVMWPPLLGVGLAIQLAVTIMLILGVSSLYRGSGR